MNVVETFINSLRSTEWFLQELSKFMKTFKPAVSFCSWSPISANIHNRELTIFVYLWSLCWIQHVSIIWPSHSTFSDVNQQYHMLSDPFGQFLIIRFLSFPLTNQFTYLQVDSFISMTWCNLLNYCLFSTESFVRMGYTWMPRSLHAQQNGHCFLS